MSDAANRSNVQAWAISAEEEQACRATDASFEWLCQLPSEFMRQFAGKWVAVQDRRIIATAETLEGLRGQLKNGDLSTVIVHRVERPGKVIYR